MTETTRYAHEPQPDSSDCPDYEYRWSVTFGDSSDDMGDDEMPFVHHDSAKAFAQAWIAGDEDGINTAIRTDTR